MLVHFSIQVIPRCIKFSHQDSHKDLFSMIRDQSKKLLRWRHSVASLLAMVVFSR